MVSLAGPFFKEGYKGAFVLLEPITEGLPLRVERSPFPSGARELLRLPRLRPETDFGGLPRSMRLRNDT